MDDGSPAIFAGLFLFNPSCHLDFKNFPSPQLRLFLRGRLPPLPTGEGRMRVFNEKARKSIGRWQLKLIKKLGKENYGFTRQM